ncbi:hypothetical protein CRUP_030994 [Coryphaenoides rupestris]|nr:hypothetical protein CRUP_030994 [Coryphaenoides rupestris]
MNGGGATTLSFGSYYGPSESHKGVLTNGVQPQGAATLPRSSQPTREERLIKFQGIGPVDETGMPIASRSSVNKPRDWYKSMFRQIHKKPEAPSSSSSSSSSSFSSSSSISSFLSIHSHTLPQSSDESSLQSESSPMKPDMESESWVTERIRPSAEQEQAKEADHNPFRLTPHGALPDW